MSDLGVPDTYALRRRVLLVGDAASLINPLTDAGIADTVSVGGNPGSIYFNTVLIATLDERDYIIRG